MKRTPFLRLAAAAAAVVLGAITAGCGADGTAGGTTTTTDASASTTATSGAASAADDTGDDPADEVDERWKDDATALCVAWGNALANQPPRDVERAIAVGFFDDLNDRFGTFADLDLPDSLRTPPTDVPALSRESEEHLADARAAVDAGDDAAADLALERHLSLFEHTAALVAVEGASCGETSRLEGASLHVPIPNSSQITAGFGSVWISQGPWFTNVVRIDPDSGEVLATIDVEVPAVKAQPADGRLIVRTVDSYVAIDPATDRVVARLAKSDVGPAANRAWAVDGALWICDGQRLHRYDPADFSPTGTVIELGVDCGQVKASSDLVVAWNYNEDVGESGVSAAVFVDPTTDQVLATVPLPSDVGPPIFLDDVVLLPASGSSVNVVVDRSTWTVAATPDYGRMVGGSDGATDGRSVYLIADERDVLVVDAQTFELTDVIEPFSLVSKVNSVAYTPGAVWVVNGDAGIVQRFDVG